ncbi:MAG TPA: HAMP domain-containing protein, partial [Lacipirellulaceae bacterium]|nr:HAMP domain-containing protein [Lacipirellulaceae bacterium]
MLSHRPIRTKLKLGLGLLLVTVLLLFGSAIYGLYAYRDLVRSLKARSAELPLAGDVLQRVSDLRVTLSQAKERQELSFVDAGLTVDDEAAAAPTTSDPWTTMIDGHFRTQLSDLVDAVDRYRRELEESPVEAASRLADDGGERATLVRIDEVIANLKRQSLDGALLRQTSIGRILREVEQLQTLAADLPSHLHERLQVLSDDVRAQYRTAIVTAWTNALLAMAVLWGSTRAFYQWFADPLQTLVDGSREVAAGNFDHRIRLAARDELGELAVAMNKMTEKFCNIRDDLDQQVRERTKQVVRSEQLASVGFLAAGVSHEINNPLASIALCSESLEGRIEEVLDGSSPQHAENAAVIRNYLQMIQREAFRCKQIT